MRRSIKEKIVKRLAQEYSIPGSWTGSDCWEFSQVAHDMGLWQISNDLIDSAYKREEYFRYSKSIPNPPRRYPQPYDVVDNYDNTVTVYNANGSACLVSISGIYEQDLMSVEQDLMQIENR